MGGPSQSHAGKATAATTATEASAVTVAAASAALAAAEAEHAAAAAALEAAPMGASKAQLEATQLELAELAEQQRQLAARQAAGRAELAALAARHDERELLAQALARATERRGLAAEAATAAQQVASEVAAAEVEPAETVVVETVAAEPAAAEPASAPNPAGEEAAGCCSAATTAHLAPRGAAVERRPGRGRCLVATRALPAGTQVMVARAVTAVLHPSAWGRRCNCCLSKPASSEAKLLRCSGCRNHFYCSAACQKLEWPSHKRECSCLAAAAANQHGLEGDALADALLLSRTLHNEQRADDGQSSNFYKPTTSAGKTNAAEPPAGPVQSTVLLRQGVRDLREMEWHEPDVTDRTLVQLAQSAADAGLLPLEPPQAAPAPAARPRSGKKKKGKKGSKGSGGQQVATVAAEAAVVPVGGLRAAAIRLAQFRCNNFGVTDELLVAIGAAVFPAPALLNHSCAPNAALSFVLTAAAPPQVQIHLLRDVAAGEEICHNFVEIANPTHVRRQQLSDVYHFECDCDRCTNGLTLLNPDVSQQSGTSVDVDVCLADHDSASDDDPVRARALVISPYFLNLH